MMNITMNNCNITMTTTTEGQALEVEPISSETVELATTRYERESLVSKQSALLVELQEVEVTLKRKIAGLEGKLEVAEDNMDIAKDRIVVLENSLVDADFENSERVEEVALIRGRLKEFSTRNNGLSQERDSLTRELKGVQESESQVSRERDGLASALSNSNEKCVAVTIELKKSEDARKILLADMLKLEERIKELEGSVDSGVDNRSKGTPVDDMEDLAEKVMNRMVSATTVQQHPPMATTVVESEESEIVSAYDTVMKETVEDYTVEIVDEVVAPITPKTPIKKVRRTKKVIAMETIAGYPAEYANKIEELFPKLTSTYTTKQLEEGIKELQLVEAGLANLSKITNNEVMNDEPKESVETLLEKVEEVINPVAVEEVEEVINADMPTSLEDDLDILWDNENKVRINIDDFETPATTEIIALIKHPRARKSAMVTIIPTAMRKIGRKIIVKHSNNKSVQSMSRVEQDTVFIPMLRELNRTLEKDYNKFA